MKRSSSTEAHEKWRKQEGDQDELASVIYKLTSVKFVRSLGRLIDVTQQVSLSILKLQKSDMNVVEANEELVMLAQKLDEMAETPGRFYRSAIEMTSAKRFGRIPLHDGGNYVEIDAVSLLKELSKMVKDRMFDANPSSTLVSCISLLTRSKLREARRFGLDVMGTEYVFRGILFQGIEDESMWPIGVHKVVVLLETFSCTIAASERAFAASETSNPGKVVPVVMNRFAKNVSVNEQSKLKKPRLDPDYHRFTS